MAERMWFAGGLPAIATDTWAVIAAGRGAVPAARRVLARAETDPCPVDLLDALLAEGLAATPAFAVVSLDEGLLTTFLRGHFVVRAELADGTLVRTDGTGVHTWRETSWARVQRAWCLQTPPLTGRAEPLRAVPAEPGPTVAAGIALRIAPPAAEAPARPDPPAAAGSSPAVHEPRTLVLPDGAHVRIDGELLIGRGPRSERTDGRALPTLIALGDAPREVSRRHLRVWRTAGGVRIEDLGSAGGTALIGSDGTARPLAQAHPAAVAVGDVAELAGGIRLRFVGEA